MNKEKVHDLLANGRTPRQIAQLGYKRTEVEQFARQLAKGKTARMRTMSSAIVAIMILIGLLSYGAYLSVREPSYLEIQTHILELANSIKPGSQLDPWFIKDEAAPASEKDLRSESALIESLTAKLNKAMTDNLDVPQVAAEHKLFGGHIFSTIFQGGVTRHLGSLSKMNFDSLSLEVAFFGRSSFTNPTVNRTLLSYHPGMNALLVAALNFTDEKWYQSLVTHELWHAKLHREGALSSTAERLSDPWVEEELQAHGVQEKVLVARTQGEYGHRLDAVIAKNNQRTFQRFLLGLTPYDLHRLDELFTPAIRGETDIRTAQYLLNLGLRWAKTRFSPTELRQQQYAIYRYLIQPQSTNVP